MRNDPKAGEFYRHFKNKLYQIICVATHSETREKMVVYQALYGDYGMFVRPLSMFMSEVDHQKYPDVQEKYRFTLISRGDIGSCQVLDKTIEQEISMKESDEKLDSEEKQSSVNTEQVDPVLMEFLEADTYEAKLEVVHQYSKVLTSKLLQTMGMAMDFSVGEGDFEDQKEALIYYLETHMRYEGRRLR